MNDREGRTIEIRSSGKKNEEREKGNVKRKDNERVDK